MKKILVAMAALAMLVVAAGCEDLPTTQGSTGDKSTAASSNK